MHEYNKRLYRQGVKRSRRFAALRKKGWTLQAIAAQEGISRQRVADILKRLNGNG